MQRVKNLLASTFFCLLISAMVVPFLGVTTGCDSWPPPPCAPYLSSCCPSDAYQEQTGYCQQMQVDYGCTCDGPPGGSACGQICAQCGNDLTAECMEAIDRYGCSC